MAHFMQAAGGRKQDRSESVDVVDNAEASFDRPRKRGRLSDSASSVTEEKKTQKTIKRRTQDRRLCFACPYAKKNPVLYRNCYGYTLARVRDVKQHLTRCHRQPIHCPICYGTFEDEDQKNSHIRSRTCIPRPSIVMEGMSEKQKRELSQRGSSKMPEEQQWFAVFDTLFHPDPRPRTPYRDRELSEDLCRFQDFIVARGPDILAEHLIAKGVTTSNLPNEERDLAAFKKEVLEEGLHRIVDQWTHDSETAVGENSAPHSPPPPSSTVDSGIEMQNDCPQLVDEDCKTDHQSQGDIITPNLGIEIHEDDENRQTLIAYSSAENVASGADYVQTGGHYPHFQSTIDDSMLSLESMFADTGQAPGPLAMSQPTSLTDDFAPFSATTGLSDLFDFEIE